MKEKRNVRDWPRLTGNLSPEDHRFLRTLARGAGMSTPQTVSMLLHTFAKDHPDLVAQMEATAAAIAEATGTDPAAEDAAEDDE